MNKEELSEILSAHRKWVIGEEGGARADLQGANLRCADLRCADLQGANLRGADLEGANLRGADLQGANLRCADLEGANLRGADLRCADLEGANLRGADLRCADLQGANLWDADLQGADLRGADLRCADLQGANLRCADLQGADLRGADLQGANLQGAKLPAFYVCPEVGAFTAWKKVSGCIVRLRVPEDARRVSSLVGRKCRAEFADVVAVFDMDGRELDSFEKESQQGCVYRLGERVHPDKFDDDIRVECTSGIHFFITRAEAEQW